MAKHVKMERLLADEDIVFELSGDDTLLAQRARSAVTLSTPYAQEWLRVENAAIDMMPRDSA